jgi:hypothetical protein
MEIALSACGSTVGSGADAGVSSDATASTDATITEDAGSFPDAFASFDASANPCGLYESPPEPVLDAFAKTGDMNLYVVDRVDEECSNAGGTHVTLRFVEGCSSRASVVHLGGHACMMQKLWQPGDLIVAAVDRSASIPMPPSGWCIDEPPAYDAAVRAFIQVQSKNDGVGVLSLHGCAP